MEILILIALASITIFVLARISFVILRGMPTAKNPWKEGKNLWDIEKPPHHNDPSYLGSPQSKIPIIDSNEDD